MTTLIVDIDNTTGGLISGWPRVRQSITTILTTRLLTRLMRLWWGCNFIDMIDKPMISQTFTDGIVSACAAINRYEPEFQVTSIQMTPSADGSCTCTVVGIYLPDQTTKSVQTTLNGSVTSS